MGWVVQEQRFWPSVRNKILVRRHFGGIVDHREQFMLPLIGGLMINLG